MLALLKTACGSSQLRELPGGPRPPYIDIPLWQMDPAKLYQVDQPLEPDSITFRVRHFRYVNTIARYPNPNREPLGYGPYDFERYVAEELVAVYEEVLNG